MSSDLQAFLDNGGYATLEDWAADSDFEYHDDTDTWHYRSDDYNYEMMPDPIDIEIAAYSAMEASGFEVDA